jgi:hypothetical protein
MMTPTMTFSVFSTRLLYLMIEKFKARVVINERFAGPADRIAMHQTFFLSRYVVNG